MTALLKKIFTVLRFTLMLMIFSFIGFKTVKAFIQATGVTKELAVADDTDEKKPETENKSEKETEFATININQLHHIAPYTTIKHKTIYNINYSSCYFYTISIPPPDQS